MKVIAGLGNPGKQYEQTRHNAGFMVVERMARAMGATGKFEARFEAIVGEGRLGTEKVVLVQPMTYMNLSGRALQKVLQFYKLTPADLLVVVDDYALPTGMVRVRTGGSAGGHNGLKSLIQCLGTQDFSRVRVGVGPLPSNIPSADFVTGRFRADEAADLERGLGDAADCVEIALTQGFTEAMQRYNRTNSSKEAEGSAP